MQPGAIGKLKQEIEVEEGSSHKPSWDRNH